MGLLPLCVIFLTLLLQRNLVYSTVSCPSGDTSGIVKNGQTCSQLISSTSYECYDATIEASCCSSCNAIVTVISDCQYGDRVTNCIVDLCRYYPNPSECCSTCLTTTPATPTSTTTTTTTTTTTPATTTITTTITRTISTTPTTTTTTMPATTTTTTPTTTTPTTTTPATTTTTTTLSPARNITTGSTSQANSSLSTSAGVIAGAIVASILGAGLMVGLTYWLFRLCIGKQLRQVVSSSTAKKDVIDHTQDEISDKIADSHNP